MFEEGQRSDGAAEGITSRDSKNGATQVVDLEQLLKKVEDETREEVRLMRDSNKKLEVYRESLDSGLRLAYES